MHSVVSVLQVSVDVVLGTTLILLQFYFIIFVSLQLFRKVNEYIHFLKLSSYEYLLNNIDKHKQIYNFKTVIMNYSLAICMLSIEMTGIIYSLVFMVTFDYTTDHPEVEKRVEQLSPNCTVNRHIGYYYNYWTARLMLTIVIILICTLFTLISLLTTFLKKRYYTHPIRGSLIRYTVWWCIQVIMVLPCSIIYLFPFLLIISPPLLFINWFYLVRESRQLARILMARIRDIVNFEWDPVLYKKSRSAYKLYVVFSILYLISILMQIVIVVECLSQYLIKILTTDQCIIKIIYGFNLQIEMSYHANAKISAFLHYFTYNITPIIAWVYFISMIFPLLSYLIWGCSSKCIMNRNTPIRYTPVYEGYKGNHSRLLLKVHRRKHFFHF